MKQRVPQLRKRGGFFQGARGKGFLRPLVLHATWKPTFNFSSNANITFHVARFLRVSLQPSHIRYSGLHVFSRSYGHVDRPDPACGHPAPR